MSGLFVNSATAVSMTVSALFAAPPYGTAHIEVQSRRHLVQQASESTPVTPAFQQADQDMERRTINPQLSTAPYLSDWFEPSLRELARLTALPVGWDGHGSRQIQDAAYATMLVTLETIAGSGGVPQPFLSPISGGALQAEWSLGGRDLEIVTRSDGSVTYLKMEGVDDESIVVESLDRAGSSGLLALMAWLVGPRDTHVAAA
jgi:hypothetical protein